MLLQKYPKKSKKEAKSHLKAAVTKFVDRMDEAALRSCIKMMDDISEVRIQRNDSELPKSNAYVQKSDDEKEVITVKDWLASYLLEMAMCW